MPSSASPSHVAPFTDDWLVLAHALCCCERIAKVYEGDPKAAEEDSRDGRWLRLWTWTEHLPATGIHPTAWVAMWVGEAGVPWWVGDAREIERWRRIVPMFDGHRELALLIIERRLNRLRPPALQSAGRKTFLASVRANAPSAFEGVRALLHRQRRVVEVEAKWGRPAGWKTGHLVAAGHVPKARVRALAERHQPPTIAELIRQIKPS